MLDIKFIREDAGSVRKNIARRNNPAFLQMFDELVDTDKQWRKTSAELNKMRAERNRLSMEIAKAKKEGRDVEGLMKDAATIPKALQELEKSVTDLEIKMKSLLMRLPNLLHDSVHDGKSEAENKVGKISGKKPEFGFEPKDHLQILQSLGMIDMEAGARSSGHAFTYLKGDVVLLDMAISRFAIDFLRRKGFTIVEPPLMINMEAAMGAEDLVTFRDQIYKIEDHDLFLIPTSEHPLAAMKMNETIDLQDLPLLLAGISPCFRKEVGTHGKYTHGLFRMHHFNKVEQFVFCKPEESWEWFEKLQQNSEEIYDQLGLHYRTLHLCSGDTGVKAAKTIDMECWMSDGKFRETGSNSNVTDYQSRRMGIKYREKRGQPAIGLVHTLNNTAVATSRIMIAIIEQNQQADGSVKIPKVLVPYMDGIEYLKKE
jgi:seryl-tRNA synthetase